MEAAPAAKVNVFVIEDDALTRESLRTRIEAHPRLRVGATAGTVAEGIAVLATRPDVLLTDLGLPDGSGIDVIREALRRHPGLPIMVITVFGNEKRVVGAIQAGAAGYLLKDDPTHEIGLAIEQLLEGGSPISPAIARHLIRLFQAPPSAAPDDRARNAYRARTRSAEPRHQGIQLRRNRAAPRPLAEHDRLVHQAHLREARGGFTQRGDLRGVAPGFARNPLTFPFRRASALRR